MAKIEFKYANLAAPRKTFRKDKVTGDVHQITKFAFDTGAVDDETLLTLAHAESVKVTIETA